MTQFTQRSLMSSPALMLCATERTSQAIIVGDEAIAAPLAQALGLKWQPTELSIEPGHAPLVYIGPWQPEVEKRFNRVCRAAQRPWLRVRLEGLHAEIGPFISPTETGCVECAETRRYRASEFPKGWLALQNKIESGDARPSSLLTEAGRLVLQTLIEEELQAWSLEPERLRTRGAVLRLNLEDLRVQRHAFLPDSHCPTCGQRHIDNASDAQVVLHSRRKPKGSLRLRNLKHEKEQLLERYVDSHLGLVTRLVKHTGNLYSNASAPTLYPHNSEPDRGFGRGVDFQSSQLSALMEALERYGGMRPNSKRTNVRGSYRALADDAIDPTTLGLHDEAQYDLPKFGFQKYSAQAQIDWVWGYSFLKRQPVLIPEGIAYYGLPLEIAGFAYECSNGCAIGGSLEEAILYGLLEVVERDAFLIAWYGRLELPEIDLASVRDPMLRLQLERLEHQSGFQVRAFDATVENGVPTVWLMAVAPEVRDNEPSLLCAAGSHLSFERAIANALGELAPNAGFFREHFQKHLEHVKKMVQDTTLCRKLEDHQLLYAHPDMRSRLNFLLDRKHKHSLASREAAHQPHPLLEDLRDDLEHVLQRFSRDGLEVIVVDQTAPEHRELGFHCVKVIVPGLIPMTFGHQYRRVQHLPRLLEIPHRLGYRSQPLQLGDLQTEPHPFP